MLMGMTHYREELTVWRGRMAEAGCRWEGHYCGLTVFLPPPPFIC